MTTFELPVTVDHDNYQQRVQLEEVNYIVRLRFNTRIEAWYVDIFDTNETALLHGRRAVLDWSLLSQFGYITALPPGFMSFFDTSTRQVPATRTDMGTRVLFLYTDRADVVDLTEAEIQALFGI